VYHRTGAYLVVVTEHGTNGDGDEPERPDDGPDNDDRTSKPDPEDTGSSWRASPLGGFRVFSEGARRRLNEALAPVYQRMVEEMFAATRPQMQMLSKQMVETIRPQLARMTEEWARSTHSAFTENFARIVVPDFVTPQLRESLERLRARVREAMPPNWPERIDLDLATQIMADQGLPLVYVPRAEIISEMLTAPNRAARVEVLLGRVDDLVEDCRSVLDEVTSQELGEPAFLAGRVVDALADGHFEAAQALAVVVAESVIYHEFGGYGRAANATRFAPESVGLWELRLRAAVAPIGAFYSPYYREEDPVPIGVSRHATVHRPSNETVSKDHAVVVTLLLASLLRALDEEHKTNPSP
jgi:hypothetical protein